MVWTRLCDVDATVAWRARPKGQLPQSVQCTIFVVTRRSTACQNYRGHVPLVGLAQRARFSACDNRSFVRSSSKRALQLFTDDHAPRWFWGYAGFGSFDVDTPINCARLRFRLKMWDPAQWNSHHVFGNLVATHTIRLNYSNNPHTPSLSLSFQILKRYITSLDTTQAEWY